MRPKPAKSLPDQPREALEMYIRELEDGYYPWYEKASRRNKYLWMITQVTVIVAGFVTAIVAALAKDLEAGDYALILADCHHAVELEFSLVSANEREASLAKVDILAEVVNGFREALHTEAKAIESAKE